MFLKRRDLFAWILLLAAAIMIIYGRQMMGSGSTSPDNISETRAYLTINEALGESASAPAIQETTALAAGDGNIQETFVVESTSDVPEDDSSRQGFRGRIPSFILIFLGIGAGISGIFILRQREPVLGPDGALILTGAALWTGEINAISQGLGSESLSLGALARLSAEGITSESIGPSGGFMASGLLGILLLFIFQVCIRELWGWIRSKLKPAWGLIQRLASRCQKPQWLLIIYAAGAAVSLTIGSMIPGLARAVGTAMPWPLFIALIFSGFFALVGLWRYGAGLRHLKEQLDRFQENEPIQVKDGAFSETEEKLLALQARHQEAIKTAVTSERFKVELISNVSHDLRTPLTGILGYSELLQKETLSPEGKKQLERLTQKAGYMSDLVDALFELTKVSSQAVESKKENIDLIRLLEQTIGLFDDQLNTAGLYVKRHYEADSAPVITDGSRMHQVFANLLGNAIKYALPGTRIHLEVKENAHAYQIRMVNTASYEMDFDPETITQRFARGDKSRSTKGSGLGLAIAQTYTESVGGQFKVAVDGDQFSAIVTLPRS